MTTFTDIKEVLIKMEENPDIARRLDGLSRPDRIMLAEALINCGEWLIEEETTYQVGFPSWVSWQNAGIY